MLNRLPLFFVEIVLEEMMLDHYSGQWSQRRPLTRASGSGNLCFQFLVVIFYLCSPKRNLCVPKGYIVIYICSNYDSRYYKQWFRFPPGRQRSMGSIGVPLLNLKPPQGVSLPTGNKVSVHISVVLLEVEVWAMSVVEVSNHTHWPSVVWAVNMTKKNLCWPGY